MRYVLTLDKCGPSMRIGDDKLISYSWHNFNTPIGVDPVEHQRKKWARFIGLCMRLIKDFHLIKEDKLIYSSNKGVKS